MKTNFNIQQNAHSSHSINALQALKKLQGIGSVALFLLIGSLQVWGANANITFSTLGLTNGEQYTDPFELDENVTITFAGGGNDGKYYTTGSGIRTYGDGTITVATTSGKITAATFTFSGTSYAPSDGDVVDEGTFSMTEAIGSWTGDASSFTLTRPSGSGNWRLQSVSVTYTPAASGYTVDFAVSPAGYGTVSPSAQLTNIASGTTITKGTGANVNKITIGSTTVTATPHAQDATYNYAFSSWSVTDNLTSVTKNITVTANFTRTPRSFSNYRTLCTPPTDPSITVSPASITNLDYIVGAGPSPAQDITLGGSNLTASVTITAPTNFEVSIDGGSTYGDSRTVTQTGGVPDVSTVKVRLKADLVVNTYGSANVTFASTGATTQNVAVTGHVLKPTITATPNPVSWSTAVGVAPSTTSVSVTGTNLKANISAALGGTNASDFSISPANITQTSGSASGSITITYTGAHNTVTTKTATLTLSSTDADDVVVNITFNVIVDPNLYFLTSLSDIHPKDKVIVVATLNASLGEELRDYYALKNATTTSTYPPDAIDVEAMISANKQTLSYSGTDLQWNINYNSVSGEFTINRDGDNDVFLYCIDNNKGLSVGTTGTYNVYNITSDYIKCKDLTRYLGVYDSDDWRTYGTNDGNIGNQAFSFYVKPSTAPYVTLGASFSEFTYEYNHGPSTPQSFTVSGANLAANLVVTAPTNYEVCKTSDGSYTSSVSFTPSTGTVSEQTVYIRLAAGLAVGDYDYAQSGGLSVTSTDPDPVKAALEGSVTPETFTVTATSNNGSYGSVSPASQNTSTTATITATPESGYRVISGAGGYTVTSGTATVVNNGNNTFTVTPTTDCTVQINFEAIVIRTISWNVNSNPYSTYTGAGTLSTSAEEGAKWSTLTLPDAPADNTLSACERTKFVGWSTSQLTGDGNSAPSDLFKSASDAVADSHTITDNTTFYAVFAKGSGDNSVTLNASTLTVTDGSVTGYAKYNGNHTGTTFNYYTTNVMPNSSGLQIKQYTVIRNTSAVPDDITSIQATTSAVTVYVSSTEITSTGGLTPLSGSTSDGVTTWTVTGSNKYFYIYKSTSGAVSPITVTVNYSGTQTDYVTSCACSWQINYITNGKKDGDGSAIWSEDNCFEQVGSTHEWQIEDFAMPNVAGQFWVGPGYFKGSGDWGHSVIADLSTVKYVRRSDKVRTDYSAVSNMIGTLNVWDNGTDDNYHVGIYPDYQITYGVQDGGDPWTKVDFNYISGTTYETEVVTAPTYFAVANFKYYVGVKTDGNTGYGGKSNTVMMTAMSGMTSNQDGKHGKWRMYEDSGSDNWYCAWVPYYVLSYDANGGTGSPSAEAAVSSEGDAASRTKVVSTTVPTRDGYTFVGWNTAVDGSGTAKAAGDNVVLSDNVVLYAQWAQNYSITYNRVGGTNVCVDETCGAGMTYTVCGTEPTKSGYIFSGWLSNEATPQTYAAGATFTMPAADVTLTAQWTANWRNLTFNVPEGGGSITGGPAGNRVLDNQTFTFPNITGKSDSKWCWTFLGWTETAPNGSGTWATTPSYIAGGATSGAITSNKTYYAVYSKTGAGASGDVECDAAAITAIGTGGGHAYADAEWTITAADLSSWKARAYVGNKGTYLQIKEDAAIYIKLPTVGGNYTSITLNHNSNSGSRTIAYRTATDGSDVATTTTAAYATSTTISIANGSTTGYIMSKSGTTTYQITSITAHFGPPTVYGHTLDDCGCQVTQFDLTYNANSTTFPGSTISCSNEDDYVFASHDDEYTFCSAPTPPTGYRFLYWAENANGTGNHWEAGETVSCLPSADLTVYAFYEPVHTVTFDNQGSQTPVTQASAGASVAVPSATSPCSAEWAFVGWSETAIAPMSFMPTLTIEAGTSTYTPTADVTLYAIYRKTSESSTFVAGMSGAYKIKATYNGTDQYATDYNGAKLRFSTTSGEAHTYYIKYVSADGGKYTIQRNDGQYIKYQGKPASSGAHTDLALSATEYFWLISANSSLWAVQATTSTDANTHYLQFDPSGTTGFKGYTNGINLAFVPTEGQYYYRTMGCAAEYDITFHATGTTINWADGYPEGSYKDIENGSTVSTFPTATFEDWTFLGWRTASYTESTGAPESSSIYSTGGNALTIASDVNLYPVFTKFADNEPFDEVNGGDYYIYYIESGSDDGYGNEKRVYAANYTGGGSASYNSTAVCGSAREFTFTKLSNGNWTIYDKTAAKYLKYSIGGNDIVHVNSASGAEWTITKNGSAYDVEAVGASSYQLLANGTSSSATFKNYATASLGATYHRITIGGCTNRTFTSSPSNVATINIHGEARITSYASKAVKANTVLSVTASNIGTANLTVSSNNSHFTVSPTSIPVTDKMAGPVSIYVTYTPAADALTDGIESAIITVSDGAGTPTTASTADGDVQGRHLPADFVIAAKNTSNNKWYALPANMNGTGNPAPVEIAVDDPNDPSVAYTEASNIYNLYTNGTPEYVQLGMKTNVNGNSKSYALWANNSVSSTDIGKNTGLAENSLDGNYRWLLTQTNTSAATAAEWKYTISNPNNANPLKLWLAAGGTGVPYWGLYASGISELRLIPAGTVVPTEAYFVEWGKNGGVVEVDAANAGGDGIAAAKVKAKLNGAESGLVTLSQTLTSVKNRASVYNYTVNFGNDIDFSAAASAGAMLTLEWYTSNDVLVAVSNISVPRIIATSGTMSTIESRDTYWTTTNGPTNEVHVLPGAVLTADAGSFSNSDVTIKQLEIYQGATVKVTSGTLDVDTLVLRNGWSRAGEKRYDVARLHIATTANLTTEANHVYADWYIDYDQYYPVAVPWDVTLANIRYRYCSVSPSIGYDQNIRLRYYDGDERAKGSGTESNWKDFGKSGNIAMPAKIVPAHGYAITAKRPSGKAFSILRMPLTIPSNSWTASGEQGVVSNTHKDTVHVIAHRYEKTPWYAMGWNFVANPYMCTFNSAGDEGITGNLSTQNGGSVRYATIPDVDFKNFEQVNIATADLKPSSGFLVQVGTTGALTFNKEKIVAPTAPARYMAEQESIAEQEVYILLSNDGGRDQMGLIIGSDYTEAYEVNADLSKMLGESNTIKTWMRYTDMDMAYVAINEELAREWIPVTVNIPANGEYTYSMLNSSIVDELEGVYLIDYKTGKTTNLIYDDYTFSSEAGTDSGRFAINAIVGKHNVPTGADLTESERNSNSPVKFIWQDKVYILHNSVIYDSTGKRVNVINK